MVWQSATLRAFPTMKLVLFFCLGFVFATAFLYQRASWLHSYEIRLGFPPVPAEITTRIRAAEAAYYEDQPLWRRALEDAQDIATFAIPRITTRLDFSLGPYRIKASTVEGTLLPFALENDYLTLIDVPRRHAIDAIGYFAEQPEFSTWSAAVYLEYLRRDHPDLAQMDWPEIAASPLLIAKLYSGYMGAGGAWDMWRADLQPGPIALSRLGIPASELTE